MLNKIQDDARDRMGKTIENLKHELSAIRTGRASLAILDGIKVDYYGTPSPLNQVAKLSVPEAALIVIQPWDPALIGEIEKSIRSSDLGLNPANDGKLIRLPIPPLTAERRATLIKKVHQMGEESKNAVRHIRRDANEAVKALEKKGDISQDDEHRAYTDVQKVTDDMCKQVDDLVIHKDQELKEILSSPLAMHTVALIVAAGRGERMGRSTPKPFLEVGGRPVLEHCLDRFTSAGVVDEIVVAVPPSVDIEALAAGWQGRSVPVRAVAGGARRQDSVAAALAVIPAQAEIIVVHDGARPLVSPELVRNVVRAAMATGAATAAVPCTDTIKEVEDGRVVRTLDRSRLVMTQTPQAFRADWLRAAHERSACEDIKGTDDAGLVELMGRPVAVVAGEPTNLKVTYPDDLDAAERHLAGSSPGKAP